MRLRALLDPRLWLSPDVRAGVFARPEYRYKTGTVVREWASLPPTPDLIATVQASLPAPRFVAKGEATPPPGMARRLSPYVEERWEAVLETCPSSNVQEIASFASRGLRTIGYRVSQHVVTQHCDCRNITGVNIQGVHVACGRAVAGEVDRQEILQSIGVQANDDATYNGFYPTILGNDVVHANYGAKGMAEHQGGKVLRGEHGNVIRGGSEIRGGRAEYKRRTKGYVLWDAGTRKDMARIDAEKKAKKKADTRAFIEREVKKMSPRIGEL